MKIDSVQIPRVCSFCESKHGFLILKWIFDPFGKSKSQFLILWILFQKGSVTFESQRIQLQINGLVIYIVPFTLDSKLVRWPGALQYFQLKSDNRWVSPLFLFAIRHLKTLEDCSRYSKSSIYLPFAGPFFFNRVCTGHGKPGKSWN